MKDTTTEDKSRQLANFEQIIEILHSLLWFSNLKREQAVLMLYRTLSNDISSISGKEWSKLINRPVC